MDAPQTHNNKENNIPFRFTLYAIMLFQAILIVLPFYWANQAGAAIPSVESYCIATYFGRYDPQCSSSEMTACYKDNKCTLYHDFFDYDDNIACSYSGDCDECKCVAAPLFNSCWIALWFFISIGLIIEMSRICSLFNCCRADASCCCCSDDCDLDGDSFVVILWLSFLPEKSWHSHTQRYDEKELYSMRGAWFIVTLFLHKIPVYITTAVLSVHIEIVLYTFCAAIVLEVVIVVLKLRYRNQQRPNTNTTYTQQQLQQHQLYADADAAVSGHPEWCRCAECAGGGTTTNNMIPQQQPQGYQYIASAPPPPPPPPTAPQQAQAQAMQPMVVQLPNGQLAIVQNGVAVPIVQAQALNNMIPVPQQQQPGAGYVVHGAPEAATVVSQGLVTDCCCVLGMVVSGF